MPPDLDDNPWNKLYNVIADATEPVVSTGGGGYLHAACGRSTKVWYPPFETEDPKACPECLEELDSGYFLGQLLRAVRMLVGPLPGEVGLVGLDDLVGLEGPARLIAALPSPSDRSVTSSSHTFWRRRSSAAISSL